VNGRIASSSYGKASVRVVKVERGPARDALHELRVDVRVSGDFDPAFAAGDNAALLPTDSMKNAVYALARQLPLDPPEPFAERVGRELLAACPAARRVTVSLEVVPWAPVVLGGAPHPHAFGRASDELRTAGATLDAGHAVVEAGLENAALVRTSGSAFRGFLQGRYTTLAETGDRLLATVLGARWRYERPPADPNAAFAAVRAALLRTFAAHPSESVQHTLHAMAEAALACREDVAAIRLVLPNLHHDLADLVPFGLDNPNAVFVPSSEPRGVIEAELSRATT
jgi:urate oxidase